MVPRIGGGVWLVEMEGTFVISATQKATHTPCRKRSFSYTKIRLSRYYFLSGVALDGRRCPGSVEGALKPGQDGGGRGDVCTGAARKGEGVVSGAYVDTGHGQQSRPALRKMAEAEEM
jgi:hypothetical protein